MFKNTQEIVRAKLIAILLATAAGAVFAIVPAAFAEDSIGSDRCDDRSHNFQPGECGSKSSTQNRPLTANPEGYYFYNGEKYSMLQGFSSVIGPQGANAIVIQAINGDTPGILEIKTQDDYERLMKKLNKKKELSIFAGLALLALLILYLFKDALFYHPHGSL